MVASSLVVKHMGNDTVSEQGQQIASAGEREGKRVFVGSQGGEGAVGVGQEVDECGGQEHAAGEVGPTGQPALVPPQEVGRHSAQESPGEHRQQTPRFGQHQGPRRPVPGINDVVLVAILVG